MSSKSIMAAGGNRVLGVIFLVLLVFFVWATYAVFTKKFVDFVPVTLQTSSCSCPHSPTSRSAA